MTKAITLGAMSDDTRKAVVLHVVGRGSYRCGHEHPDHYSALPCTRRAKSELERRGIVGSVRQEPYTATESWPTYVDLDPELDLEPRDNRGRPAGTKPSPTLDPIERAVHQAVRRAVDQRLVEIVAAALRSLEQ